MAIEIGEKEVAGAVGVLGLVTGWILSGFGFSRKHGRNEERIDDLEEDVVKNSADIVSLKKNHDDDMKEVREFFRTPSGGQKFMTFPDHDHACVIAQRTTIQEINHLTAAIVENTSQVGELGRMVADMQISVGILKEEKKTRDTGERRRAGDAA